MKTMIRLTVAIAMMFAINNSAFAAHYEGDAGPNARYEMDTETGIMRIYGNGDLYNYHGSWTYYSSYSQLDHTGNGVTGTQNGAQYTGNSPLNTNFGTNRNPIYLRDYLTTVIIEEGITSIGAAFFYNCQKLTSITMPSSLTLINYEAFRSCKKLEQIEIGPNVEHVMGRWATECDKFNYISVNPANTHYVSIGGVLYSADTTILVCFPEALNTIEYVIPEGTVYAATDALYHLRLVQSITIPTTMVDIEYGSFDQCPNLKTLVLKSSTPPTLHKDVAGTHLTGIFVPCGEAAQYSNNGNWNSYGGGHIQNAVVVEFYVETNNIELGDVEITSRADCEGYEMTITAVPTNFGTFSHWQDGSTTNPRTIAIDKEDLSIIYRYKAFFDPKPYRITLNKTTEQLGSWFNQLNVKDYYQVSATKGSTTIATTGTTMTVTSPENTFFYGDTVTLYCDITGSGVKFSKWGDGSTDDPRVIVVKETGSYTGQLTYSAEIKSGSISIKTASNNNNYGTTSPTSQTATFGDEVTFSATPKPKYQLSYWDDEPGNRTPELTRTVIATGDKTYTAFFAKLTYNITTASNNDDWGSCSGLGTYEVDASVTLNATPEPGYRFVNWNEDPSLTNPSLTITVTENKTYTGYFEPIPYTIRFLNENGDVLQSGDVDFGTTPVYTGATPQKASSQQWNYTFDKWSPDITPVSGAKDYTATYTSSVRSYPITFKNEDGTQIDVINVNFGNVPLYNGPTPTKTPTAQYTYTFAGWTPTPTAVTGAATYTATYNSTVNQYTIRFMNGTNVLQSDKLNYGATPSYIGETPEKSATAQYTYTFDGWDSEITEVTDDKDYKAQFTETINQYTIRFLNGNEVLQTEDLDYGATPVYKGTTPTKEADAQYTYTFAGWDKNIATVTGTCDYKAQFTPTLRTYTITFKNHDGTVLSSATVDYGVVPTYTGAVPQKPADAQYTYTFSGWSPTVVAAVSNAVYTAQFSTTNVPYAINFLNWDNSPLTATQYYALNEIPSFDGTPTRPATAQYTYTFDKWDPEIAAVTKDQDYKATYSQTVNTYTITFVDDDNTTLKTLENVPYGETPVYGSDPTKAQTAQYTYSFAGWTPAITAVTGAQTYKATYNSTLRSYTITFVDGDGNATYDVLDFGEMPVAPENPEKTATAEYSYNFKGWDKPIMSVSGDATYTAQFNAIKNKYTVQFRNWNDDVLQSSEVEYGQMPSYIGGAPTKVSDAQYNYTWTNEWDKPIETVKGNTIYKATFNHTLRAYTITFVNENGSELWHHSFNYGTTPTYGGDTPTKLPTAEFTYTHSGWTPEITEVVGDAVYTATFIGTKRSYTVKFVNDDGNELESNTYLYGLHPAYNGSTPQKANTAQYTYTFSGWDPTITNETTVTGDITYTAQYSSTVNAYPITFVNYDGTELYQSQFKYGVTPEFNGVEPTKPTDGVSTFKFSGWTPALAPVTGPATYTAKFVVDGAATHTITFLDYNGNLLYTEEIEYGQMPTPADPMRSQDDHYTYEFAGWDPELAIVTAPAEYTATYNSTVRKYQITFIDGDNNSETLEVEYGELPTPTTPSKTTTDEFTYTFSGWDPTLTTVTGAKTYRAMFTPVRRKYTITFVDYDGSETKFDVPYGETPSKANPSRPADVQYTYTFTGWTPTIAPVTGAATYTATYSSTLNQYTITVLSADANMGVVSGSGTFNYNAEISITADGQTGYHFTKWNDENTSNPRGITVKGDAEYTAYFAPNTNTAYTLNIYTQNIENDDYQLETQPMTGTTNQLSSYDAPALTGFELQNYEQVNINADGSSVLSVYYNRRSYNLTWNANGGDDLTGTYTNGSVKYQAAITAPNAPTRIGFDFNGWQPNLTTMPAEDIECIALWNEKGDTPYKIEHWLQNVEGDSYTLDFVDDTKKGKTNAQTNVAAITYTGFTAETEKTVNCNINADGSGVAKIYYKRNIHTLHWMVDGVEITENCTNGNVRFGAAIIAPADPEKDGYTFAGWNSTIATTMPDENVSYTALWTPNANTAYTVNHYKQNIDGSYAATPDATDNLTGTTGSPTAAETYEYEGFTSQPFDQVQIAADGSTVINIRYTRNHHELIWNLGICTIGEEPYTESNDNIAFGTPIVAPVLTKDGYSLTWDTEIPATMPDHDLTLTAIWTANDTEYTVNHWLRTVDGTLYTLDATETLYGPTDAMTEAAAKTYTGFTAQAFNQTTIAADGSTVINIEYSRNWHSLTWNIGEGVINTETAYTHAADSVTYGQPIIAPVLIREGFSYSWNIDIPKTMPDNDIVATTVWTDTTVTVANYVVRHNQQALDGSFAIAATDTLSGFANSPTAAVALTFEGFTAQPFEQGTISTVSTTIVEIMYNRNNYNLTWNFNGGTTTGEYTSGQVLFGTPIIAPTPTKEGFGFKSWDNLPATMPAHDVTITAVWEEQPKVEPVSFTAPATFDVCEREKSIVLTNISGGKEIKFEWSIDGKVDKSQTGPEFYIPEDAPVNGTISVTGYIPNASGSARTEQIVYKQRKRITTSLWDDVITAICTNYSFESFRWYHNGTLVDTTEYYNEVGGLTGKYYLVATTESGVEICSCESDFGAAPEATMAVYPNPTVDNITVAGSLIETGATISVIDGNGKEWLRKTVENDGSETVNVSQMPQGMYIVKVGDKVVSFIKL